MATTMIKGNKLMSSLRAKVGVLLVSSAIITASGTVIAGTANPIDWRSAKTADVQDQKLMRIGHSVNMEWSSHTAALKRFAELVSIYSDNEIRGEIYPGSQLGGENEMLQQTRQGSMQVTFPAINNLASVAPIANIFILPYIASSTEEVNKLQDELTPIIKEKVIEQAGLRIVGWENSGWRAFFYKGDSVLEEPADLSSMNMRVPPNRIMNATYRAWGGNPTPLAWNELYSALEQGVVDGGDSPVTDVIGMNFHEVINNISTLNYTILSHPIVVSERWYQGLTEKQKEAVLRAGEEATEYVRWWQPIDEQAWWERAREAGVTVAPIEDESLWKETAQSIWPEFYDSIAPNGEGEALVKKAQDILQDFRENQE